MVDFLQWPVLNIFSMLNFFALLWIGKKLWSLSERISDIEGSIDRRSKGR